MKRIDQYGESNHKKWAGGQHFFFRVGTGVDVFAYVERQNDELLPVHDPVAGKKSPGTKERRGLERDRQKISCHFRRSSPPGAFAGLSGLFEKDQNAKEHQEHAESRRTRKGRFSTLI